MASSSSSYVFATPLQQPIDPDVLDNINSYLHTLTPEDILKWGMEHLPNLYQTTAFGLTGLVQLDMLSRLSAHPPPLIFIDTLYHFKETLELVEEVKKRYNRDVHVYKPEGCDSAASFEAKHGEKLWERDETFYDYLVKVWRFLRHIQGRSLLLFPFSLWNLRYLREGSHTLLSRLNQLDEHMRNLMYNLSSQVAVLRRVGPGNHCSHLKWIQQDYLS